MRRQGLEPRTYRLRDKKSTFAESSGGLLSYCELWHSVIGPSLESS
jgi:hypothetical protein